MYVVLDNYQIKKLPAGQYVSLMKGRGVGAVKEIVNRNIEIVGQQDKGLVVRFPFACFAAADGVLVLMTYI